MARKQLNLPDSFAEAIGIDEAGRGCLAGPVVAAAVYLPPHFCLPGLADSKKLSPAKRATLAPCIKREAIAWGVGIVWQKRIDAINILQATFEAMAKAANNAIKKMGLTPRKLLIDGDKIIPVELLEARLGKGIPVPEQKAVIKGDNKIAAISAASILAKTFRDNLMTRMDKIWPAYQFARHKGYGTAAHYSALDKLGPCDLHRLSFRGVSNGSR